MVADWQSGSDGYLTDPGSREGVSDSLQQKVMLASISIWSADCQSITGSHFLQIGENFTEWRKEKLTEKTEMRIFGLSHHVRGFG